MARGVLQVVVRTNDVSDRGLKKIKKKYQETCDAAYGQGVVRVILVRIGEQDSLDATLMWEK